MGIFGERPAGVSPQKSAGCEPALSTYQMTRSAVLFFRPGLARDLLSGLLINDFHREANLAALAEVGINGTRDMFDTTLLEEV